MEEYRVYKKGEWPKPKKDFYRGTFSKRQKARQFCRKKSWHGELTIVHPDGTEEKYN